MTVYKRKIVSLATVFVMLMACLFAMPQLTFAETAGASEGNPAYDEGTATLYANGADLTVELTGDRDKKVVITGSQDFTREFSVDDAKQLNISTAFSNGAAGSEAVTKDSTVTITVKSGEIGSIIMDKSGYAFTNSAKLTTKLNMTGGKVGTVTATKEASTTATDVKSDAVEMNILDGKVAAITLAVDAEQGGLLSAATTGTYFASSADATGFTGMKELVKVKVNLAGGSIEGYEEDTYIGNMAVNSDMIFVQDRDLYNKLMSAKGKDGAELDKYTAKTASGAGTWYPDDPEFSLVSAVPKIVATADTADVDGNLNFVTEAYKLNDGDDTAANYKVVTLTASYKKLDYWRVYGDTRIDTAIEAADMILGHDATGKVIDKKKANGFVVASANDYPDALSAAPLTAAGLTPILLVNSASEAKVIKYIIKNSDANTAQVSIVGGEGVVSAAFESELKAAIKDTDGLKDKVEVVRYAGANRILTNTAVLDSKDVVDYLEDPGAYLVVCTANEYADALAASAAGDPIMLVGNTLTDDQIDYIKNLNPANKINVVIVGGTGAVSQEVEYWFRDYIKTKNSTVEGVERYAGDNRFETARLVAEGYTAASDTPFVVARGYDFPDALVAGPMAMHFNTGVVLAEGNVTKPARQLAVLKGINKLDPWKAYVMGGPTLVTNETMTEILK